MRARSRSALANRSSMIHCQFRLAVMDSALYFSLPAGQGVLRRAEIQT
jgi:hypothetical protein